MNLPRTDPTPKRRGWLAPAVVLAVLAGLAIFVPPRVLDLFLFHPSREQSDAARGPDVEQVTYYADDGAKLVAHFVHASARRRTVLFFHGNAATASACVPFARALAAEGSDVLLAEYRGYGASDGHPSPRRVLLDGEAAYQYLTRHRRVPVTELVVHGQSLGGAVAADVLARRDAHAGILESTFTSLDDMARAMFGAPLTVMVPEAVALDTVSKLADISEPLLQLHGDADEVVPIALGRGLHEHARPGSQFVVVAGGRHNLPGDARLGAILPFLAAQVP